jgi:hypothetical protein
MGQQGDIDDDAGAVMAKAARLIERLWAAAYAILKSGASQFRVSRIDPPPPRTLDLWISGTLAGQDVLPSQGSRITIEPGERTGSATDHSLVGLGVRPMRIPGADEAIEHLARWAGRGRWKEECMRAIAAHFEPVCAKSA